jgi:hypothetical protein
MPDAVAHDAATHDAATHDAVAKPECHRDPAGEDPAAGEVPAETDNKSAPASECAMTSCSKEAPVLLTAQGLPCLAASTAVEFNRDPGFEAIGISHPFACFSLEASPPNPPPES